MNTLTRLFKRFVKRITDENRLKRDGDCSMRVTNYWCPTH